MITIVRVTTFSFLMTQLDSSKISAKSSSQSLPDVADDVTAVRPFLSRIKFCWESTRIDWVGTNLEVSFSEVLFSLCFRNK